LTDWGALVAALSAEHELAVFCDNSAFDDDAPPDLWAALLSEPGRLVLTERVNVELKPWLLKRPTHPVTVALLSSDPGIGERLEPKSGEPGKRVFDYYMALLASRRNGLEIARMVFVRQHGRVPDADEERGLADEVQKYLDQRGRLIATKPAGKLTDEALVYLAVEHALTTGKQTLVLTRDADVEEQFFKLLWLIETHYRGMLLADSYADHFGIYPIFQVPDSLLNDPRGPFEPHDAVLIERDPDMRDLLPREPHCVGISCMNAGTYFSQARFMGETEMGRLLQIKDATGGLSTDRFGERNMHASIHPIPTGLGHDCAALVYDRRAPVGTNGASVAKIDLAQALIPCEQSAQVVPKRPPSLLWTPPSGKRWS
jgi:hypothetical protein